MSTPRADRGPTHRASIVALLCAGAVAATAIVTFAGAIGYSFSQDDFVGLARAQGLIEPLASPWRYLSRQVYFDVMHAVAGLDAGPYHWVSLIGHALTAVLVLGLLGRRFGLAAALVGSMFFAAHPALYRALYWIAAHGEVYSLLFGLLAFALATEVRGRWAWLAVPCFLVSLLFKESTVLLPLAIVAVRAAARPSDAATTDPPPASLRRLLDPVVIALGLVSLLYVASFAASNAFAVRDDLAASAPYAIGFGADLWRNLLTYLGWTVNIPILTVRTSADAVEPAMLPVGVIVALGWLSGLAVPALRRRGWLAAGLLYLVLLIPVLPLRNHTYHYYLYAPLFGAAWCGAALFDVAASRLRPRYIAWGAAATLAILLAVNGKMLVDKIEHTPYVFPELRSDPTVDRALVADRVRRDLAAADLQDGVHLYFWSPTLLDIQRGAGRDTSQVSYLERNVESALQGGLAVRVMFPQVREVSFVRAFRPIDNSGRYAVYRIDGALRVGAFEDIQQALDAMQRRGSR